MRIIFVFLMTIFNLCAFGQNLQLHEDFRHSVDPEHAQRNFPTLYFEYFKQQDSGKAFFKPGSFLLKMQADFMGQKSNMGKYYLQVSQSFRCWQPKIFLNLQYSGGLGVTEPKQYSYYIQNTFSAGLAYPFQWLGGFWSVVINYKYLPYSKPSHDPLLTLYWWKGLLHYKLELLGDFSAWTENRNHGDDFTKGENGKRFSFFAEPQAWYNLNKTLATGLKMNVYYHVNTTSGQWQLYPTIGVRAKL